MPLVKYLVWDWIFAELLAGITSSQTSIVLKTGQGSRIPVLEEDEVAILTLEEYDEDGILLSNEKVLLTDRITDTLTVERWFWGDTQHSFGANSYIKLLVTSAIIKDIQNYLLELNDLKLNKWTLREDLAPFSLVWINGEGEEVLIPVGATGQYLRSFGEEEEPEWDTPPLDIHGQTDANIELKDEIVFFSIDWEIIGKCPLSEALDLIRASDALASAGTDDEKFITSEQLKKYAGVGPSAGSVYTLASSAGFVGTSSGSFQLAKTLSAIQRAWTYTFSCNISTWPGVAGEGRLYKNGVAFGTVFGREGSGTSSYSENLTVAEGDIITYMVRTTGGGGSTQLSNFAVKFDLVDWKVGAFS